MKYLIIVIACLLCSTVMAQTGLPNTARIPDPKPKVIKKAEKPVPESKADESVKPPAYSLTLNEAQVDLLFKYIIQSKQLLPFVAAQGIKPIDVTNLALTVDTIPDFFIKSYKAWEEKYKPKVDTIKKASK